MGHTHWNKILVNIDCTSTNNSRGTRIKFLFLFLFSFFPFLSCSKIDRPDGCVLLFFLSVLSCLVLSSYCDCKVCVQLYHITFGIFNRLRLALLSITIYHPHPSAHPPTHPSIRLSLEACIMVYVSYTRTHVYMTRHGEQKKRERRTRRMGREKGEGEGKIGSSRRVTCICMVDHSLPLANDACPATLEWFVGGRAHIKHTHTPGLVLVLEEEIIRH